MPDPGGYTWDAGLGRYRDRRGRLVPAAAVRSALDAVVDAAQADMVAASEQLQRGEIEVGDWQARMEKGLKLSHTAAAAAAKGGWARVDPADWSRVAVRLRGQYRYLRDFAFDVANGLPLDGSFLVRVGMYGNSAIGTYENVRRVDDLASGYTEERRILHSRESCPSCVRYAGLGWQPAGTLPDIGEASECLTNDRCTFERRKRVAPPTPERKARPEPEPSPPPRPEPVVPEPDRLAARKAQVAGRIATIAPEVEAAGLAVDRARAEYDRVKADPRSGSAERIAARDAWFAAEDRHAALRAEHRRLETWESSVARIPTLVPPGPIAERIADYPEGDAKVRRVVEELTPIRERHRAARAEFERASIDWERAQQEKQFLVDESDILLTRGKGLPKAKQKRLDELKVTARELAAKRDSLRWVKGTGPAAEIRSRLAEVLAVDRPTAIEWEHGAFDTHKGDRLDALDDVTRKAADEAAAWVARITRAGDEPAIRRAIGMRDGQRAYHAGDGTHIAVMPREPADVIVHELGHAIDESVKLGKDNVLRRSKEFLDHRVAGEAAVRIKDVAGPGSEYRDDEMGRGDDFGKVFGKGASAHYVGKDYSGSATEIVSMGLQQLYNDPLKLVENDPEFAAYLFGILDGSLR